MATEKELTLASVKPSTAIVRLAVPATLALLATMVISFTMRKLIKYDQIG